MAQGRRQLCETLLRTQKKIADDLMRIDEAKEALRAIAEGEGEGFIEELGGLGSVEVKAGCEKKLKGIVPKLAVEAFLALSERRRDTILHDGLVTMDPEYLPARRPSVTVRL